MGRHADYSRLLDIYETVRHSPGIKVADIGKHVPADRKTIWRALIAMDKHGLYLCEDDEGRLQVYEG